MNNEKMYLINKLFNNESIRTVWNKDSEKYYISVVDVVGVLSESTNPQTYWRVLKKRLKDEENQTGDKLSPVEIKGTRCKKVI